MRIHKRRLFLPFPPLRWQQSKNTCSVNSHRPVTSSSNWSAATLAVLLGLTCPQTAAKMTVKGLPAPSFTAQKWGSKEETDARNTHPACLMTLARPHKNILRPRPQGTSLWRAHALFRVCASLILPNNPFSNLSLLRLVICFWDVGQRTYNLPCEGWVKVPASSLGDLLSLHAVKRATYAYLKTVKPANCSHFTQIG